MQVIASSMVPFFGYRSIPFQIIKKKNDSPDFIPFLFLNFIFGNCKKIDLVGKNSSPEISEIISTENLTDSFSTFFNVFGDTSFFDFFASKKDNDHHHDRVHNLFCKSLSDWK